MIRNWIKYNILYKYSLYSFIVHSSTFQGIKNIKVDISGEIIMQFRCMDCIIISSEISGNIVFCSIFLKFNYQLLHDGRRREVFVFRRSFL